MAKGRRRQRTHRHLRRTTKQAKKVAAAKVKPSKNPKRKATRSVGANVKSANSKGVLARVAAAANHNSLRPIFKLNEDCFEKVFDLLSINDLIATRLVCKQLREIAGHCFSVNYADAQIGCENEGLRRYGRKMNDFSLFVRKLMINSDVVYQGVPNYYPDHEHSDSWDSDCSCAIGREFPPIVLAGPAGEKELRFVKLHQFDSIKEVKMKTVCLTSKFDCIKAILSRVEVVKLMACKMNGELHDDFLVFCKQMKRLCFDWIRTKEIIIGLNNDWLLRRYPQLEHLEISLMDDAFVSPNLMPVLENNPNIRRFATNGGQMLVNKETMLNCNVKLDVFAVHTIVPTKELYDLINALYDRGFYKRLHFYCIKAEQKFIKGMALLKGLVKLYSSNANDDIDFSCLTDLKELCFDNGKISNAKKVATSLVNLQRLHLTGWTNVEIVSTFIEHSEKLTDIKVNCICGVQDSSGNRTDVIGLKSWNDKRKKLNGTHKVTVFVEEENYLATKFAMDTTVFDLVELKRNDATVWSHEFGY